MKFSGDSKYYYMLLPLHGNSLLANSQLPDFTVLWQAVCSPSLERRGTEGSAVVKQEFLRLRKGQVRELWALKQIYANIVKKSGEKVVEPHVH